MLRKLLQWLFPSKASSDKENPPASTEEKATDDSDSPTEKTINEDTLPPEDLPTPETAQVAPEECTLDFYEAKKLSGHVTIPAGVRDLQFNLFEGNEGITSVTVPGTVKIVGVRAFADCENLERVTLEEGIEEIGGCAFVGCKKLRHVTYPDSVKKYQGDSFRDTTLAEPVLNASKTILIHCPESVTGVEWTVPDTVKVIAWQAFQDHKAMELLHLPEGLEVIEGMAFMDCGLREITIPHSVRKIGKRAFWCCDYLKKATVLNPQTIVGMGAFSCCDDLSEINYGDMHETDKIFHLKGQPFLIQHLEDAPNLSHASHRTFRRYTALCAKGDADAMNALADWFEEWSQKRNASQFYIRAAHYWRYRAYRKGNTDAKEWFSIYFSEHPGEPLESILFESSDHREGMYNFTIPGELLNALGYDFFEPGNMYEIHQFEGDPVVEASTFADYEGPDEDGFGAEYNYYWWFLDENMQPIPGIERLYGEVRETDFDHFKKTRAKAVEILLQRMELQ